MTDQFVNANKMVPESSMTDLSPAAQAVLDAFRAVPDLRDCPSIAAALRAAADQVAPIRLIDEPDFSPGSCCERVLREERTEMRGDLLAIAAELEGTCDKTSTSADQ